MEYFYNATFGCWHVANKETGLLEEQGKYVREFACVADVLAAYPHATHCLEMCDA